jgi:hypothetical protein
MHRGGGIRERAERVRVAEPVDYFVIIKRSGRRWARPRTNWTWEIRRRSEPRGIKNRGVEYASPQAAKLAGETALKELLNNLS